jgi:uncharacterized protein (DUF2267 family)
MATTQHLPPSKAGIKGQNLPSKSGTTTAQTPATKTGPTAQTPPTKTGPTVQTPPTKTGTMAKTVTVQDLFKKTLDKTHHWLNEIKEECGLKDIHQAYTLLRGVLLTIRDRIPTQEAVHLGAQLPMLVRGFYYEGWNPLHTPDKDIKTKEDFFKIVIRHIAPSNLIENIECNMVGVLKVIQRHVPSQELEKVKNLMPHNLKEIFTPTTAPSNV